MNELFNNQYIELTTYYKVEKNKSGVVNLVVITEKEFNTAKLNEKLKDSVKSLRTKWKVPNWKTGNDIYQMSSFWNPQKNDMDVNWNKYRDLRFKQSLVDWDAKTESGDTIPCNSETIDMLSENMAVAILKQFDEATRPSKEDEEKNS